MGTRQLRKIMALSGLLAVLGVGGGIALASGANPSFTFSSDESGATYTCSLDGAAAGACTSPKAYSNLSPGQHTVTITSTFTVPTPPPPPPPSNTLFGDQNVAATPDYNDPNVAQAFQYTASASGTASSVSLYVDSGNTATTAIVGIYSDSANKPASLLASGSLASPKSAAWNTIPVGSATITSGTKYWIAILGTGGQINYRDTSSGTAPSYVDTNTNLTAPPATYGVGKEYTVSPASAYVNGTSGPPPPPVAPSNTAAPTISGTPQQGDTLTASSGTWSGTAPITYTYAWSDGATGPTDTLPASDVGQNVSVKVTATNSAGSANATSTSVGPVTAAPPPGSCPVSTANVPDGPDPWGGCFPGPQTSGVPAGMNLVDVTGGNIQPPNSALPSDNTGWTNSGGTLTLTSSTAVVDGVKANDLNLGSGSGGTVKNSDINGATTVNSNNPITFLDDTMYGGTDTNFNGISAFGSGQLNVFGDNISGGGHVLIGYSNVAIKDSYLHDTASTSTAHQNGILLDGGSNNSVTHSTVRCENPTGPNDCTSDIALLENDGQQINETMTKNLILSSPRPSDIAFCVYPGPNYSPAQNSVSGVSWTNNVLQKGADGHCNSHYGEVYGWYPATCSPNACTWSGDVYDDGTTWNP